MPVTAASLAERLAVFFCWPPVRHNGVLESTGLIIAAREGRVRWNYLNAMPIQDIHGLLALRQVGAERAALVRNGFRGAADNSHKGRLTQVRKVI